MENRHQAVQLSSSRERETSTSGGGADHKDGLTDQRRAAASAAAALFALESSSARVPASTSAPDFRGRRRRPAPSRRGNPGAVPRSGRGERCRAATAARASTQSPRGRALLGGDDGDGEVDGVVLGVVRADGEAAEAAKPSAASSNRDAAMYALDVLSVCFLASESMSPVRTHSCSPTSVAVAFSRNLSNSAAAPLRPH